MKNLFSKKIVVITVLTLLLLIPLMMIRGVIDERSGYRYQVRNDITQSWTGEQMMIGPVLVIPYREIYQVSVWNKKLEKDEIENRVLNKKLMIAPEQLSINGNVKTESRVRGIYSIPVYRSQLNISGNYSVAKLTAQVNSSNTIEWEPAYLSVMVNDVRGVEKQPVLLWQGKKIEFEPDSLLGELRNGMHAPLGVVKQSDENLAFSFDLDLHGMERLKFSPLGKSTSVTLKSDWPDPSFIGRYLPSERLIDENGFTASWNVSSFSSSVAQNLQSCKTGSCSSLANDMFGVTLFNSVDIYQQSERSVKYGLLFIGLTFVVFFLFEVIKGLRLHPMQYLLVGLELSVFFLLLVSLSELMAFAMAYLIATLASTALIGFYVSSILQSYKLGGFISAGLLLLYGMLYGILGSEDNALLMGSMLIFSVLALVMTVTRRIDWYELSGSPLSREENLAIDS